MSSIMKPFKDFLLESPYYHEGHYSGPIPQGSYSSATLSREFIHLIDFSVNGSHLKFYKNKNIPMIVGVIPSGVRWAPVFILKGKSHPTTRIKLHQLFQVDGVSIDEKYRGLGATSVVYKHLVSCGISLLSDSSQFEPGKQLWKSIATDPGYLVTVFDAERGNTGRHYNGKNIPDSHLWSSGHDYSKEDVLFLLQKR